ncbi:MAG: hypothetical protein ACR2OY_04620 [Boseongicola sp.]
MIRSILAVFAVLLLAACAPEEDLSVPPEALGEFRLGHNIAIADETVRGPFSREFTETQMEAAVQSAVAKRLRRYDGDGLYHLGIVVGGVVLAQPGIPAIYAPSSVMLLDVTIFDNSTRQKLNEEPMRIHADEGFKNMVPILGSGLVRGPEDQLANLSANAARKIEQWIRENPEWFEPKPGQVRVPYDVKTPPPAIADVKDELKTN